jgi:hypothetical protein
MFFQAYRAVLPIFFALSLIQCGAPPPQGVATIDKALQQSLQAQAPTTPMALTIRAREHIDGGVLVVFSYETPSTVTWCTRVVEQIQKKWKAESGSCLTYPSTARLAPVEPFGLGGASIPNISTRFAYTAGVVSNPTIQQDTVSYDTLPSQTISVQNGAYVAVVMPKGPFGLMKIEGLDGQGNVVYTQQYSTRPIVTRTPTPTPTFTLKPNATPTLNRLPHP